MADRAAIEILAAVLFNQYIGKGMRDWTDIKEIARDDWRRKAEACLNEPYVRRTPGQPLTRIGDEA